MKLVPRQVATLAVDQGQDLLIYQWKVPRGPSAFLIGELKRAGDRLWTRVKPPKWARLAHQIWTLTIKIT